MGIRIEAVKPDEVLSLAETADLTTYDASYLWLAQAREAGLVTLDRALHQASRRCLSAQ